MSLRWGGSTSITRLVVSLRWGGSTSTTRLFVSLRWGGSTSITKLVVSLRWGGSTSIYWQGTKSNIRLALVLRAVLVFILYIDCVQSCFFSNTHASADPFLYSLIATLTHLLLLRMQSFRYHYSPSAVYSEKRYNFKWRGRRPSLWRWTRTRSFYIRCILRIAINT